MVYVKVIGGLGNQLFQYATGRSIAIRENAPLKLDLSWFNDQQSRMFYLDQYNIVADYVNTVEQVLLKALSKNGFRREPASLALQLFNFETDRYQAIKDHFVFDKRLSETKGSIYLIGYWQSERYFKSHKKMIKQELTLNTHVSTMSAELARKIRSGDAVSVHVRRGDYVNNKANRDYYGECTIDYYLSALRIITETIANPNLFIFSDDPEWAKQNLRFNYNVSYVEHNGEELAYEDLWLMSICDHHVIANSSFSWWGAWLGENPRKLVIAPRVWYRDKNRDTSSLLPDSWVRI